MLPLESQVSSLELSKKLRELGVRQNAYWSWCFNKGRHKSEDRTYLLETQKSYNFLNENRCWSAFSVAELGEMLPGMIDVGLKPGQMRMVLVTGRTLGDGWRVDYRNEAAMPISTTAETEVDARAKMLIYLIERGGK